jgi:glutathione S-transferase
LYKNIGAHPTETKPDGSPHYTLPVIKDASTGAVISESTLIAEYLDTTYPDTPKLFPPGTAPLQYAFMDAFRGSLDGLFQLCVVRSNSLLNPGSTEHHRRTISTFFGVGRLEDLVRDDEHQKTLWEKARTNFAKVDAWYQKGKDEGPYLMGNTICFADLVFASFAFWPKRVWGEDSAEWQDMLTWHEGRFGVLAESLAKYETIL